MSTNITRTLFSTFAAIAFAAGFAHTANAQTNIQAWTLDAAQSDIAAGKASIIRAKAGSIAESFLFIANGKVYLGVAQDGKKGLAKAAYSGGNSLRAVQIGDHARMSGSCGFRCQSGLPENRMTVTFRSLAKDGAAAKSLVAFDQR